MAPGKPPVNLDPKQSPPQGGGFDPQRGRRSKGAANAQPFRVGLREFYPAPDRAPYRLESAGEKKEPEEAPFEEDQPTQVSQPENPKRPIGDKPNAAPKMKLRDKTAAPPAKATSAPSKKR